MNAEAAGIGVVAMATRRTEEENMPWEIGRRCRSSEVVPQCQGCPIPCRGFWRQIQYSR